MRGSATAPPGGRRRIAAGQLHCGDRVQGQVRPHRRPEIQASQEGRGVADLVLVTGQSPPGLGERPLPVAGGPPTRTAGSPFMA
jgi:hypothetical protein